MIQRAPGSELIARFELATSSLPIRQRSFSCVVSCRLFVRVSLNYQASCGFSVRLVSSREIHHLYMIFGVVVGFWWGFVACTPTESTGPVDNLYCIMIHFPAAAAFNASLTTCPALRIDSLLAWEYIRSVTAGSECPRRALTDVTSAPLVIATEADVCLSKCG